LISFITNHHRFSPATQPKSSSPPLKSLNSKNLRERERGTYQMEIKVYGIEIDDYVTKTIMDLLEERPDVRSGGAEGEEKRGCEEKEIGVGLVLIQTLV
jgi:hypothetical protein